ncbi:MAG: IS21 family transposase [Proteobacteria bacterium]|nr:IS21 family transposase [Pseudomonadota bacterium]
MITLKSKQEIIIRHIRDGESIRSISRNTGFHRKTILRYVKEYTKSKEQLNKQGGNKSAEITEEIIVNPRYDSSNRKKRKITKEIIEIIKECLSNNERKRMNGQHKQQMKKIDIYELLKSKGYDIGYTTIVNTTNGLENKQSEAFIKQEYEYGDVCEFDWGEVKIFIKGKLKKYYIAVFTSAKGNYRYARLFSKQDMASFQQSHALFFESIGGVYKTMVYDNMRVAIKRFVGYREKEATEGLLKLSIYYNFGFRFCNVRKGNEKGHVERSVEYVRRKVFSKLDEFDSLNEANIYLEEECKGLNTRPQRGNQNKTAMEIFKVEKEYLFPNPPMFECAEIMELKVDKYSTISVKTCHYSVPDKYVNKMVTVKLYPNKIMVYNAGEKISIHERKDGFGEWDMHIEDYVNTLRKKPGALIGSVGFHQMSNKLRDIFEKWYGENPKDFIELIHYMSANNRDIKAIEEAIEQLRKISFSEITTDKIKIICERETRETRSYREENETEQTSKRQLLEISSLLPNHEGKEGKEVKVL